MMGLRVEKALKAKNLLLQSDSKLVIGQIKEEYEEKKEKIGRASCRERVLMSV